MLVSKPTPGGGAPLGIDLEGGKAKITLAMPAKTESAPETVSAPEALEEAESADESADTDQTAEGDEPDNT